jgi:hypothetical protein
MTTAQFDILNLILAQVVAFLGDPRSITIYLLIFLDLATGVMAALRTGTFDWKELGRFLGRDIGPYLVGYLAAYVTGGVYNALLANNTDPNLRPILAAVGLVIEQLGQTVGWGAAALALLASIGRNLGEVRTQIPVSPLRTALREVRQPIARILGG